MPSNMLVMPSNLLSTWISSFMYNKQSQIFMALAGTYLRPLSVLPLSYNHRLFSPTLAPPFPVEGLGVLGIHRLPLSFPGPKGDGVPMLDLLLASRPPPSMDFCHNGLADGENGFSELPNNGDSDERSLRDKGVLPALLCRLRLLAPESLRGVGERAYRGGVTYRVPGVGGGVALGSRPRRARCDGVNAMSKAESWPLYRGHRAMTML